MKVAITREVSSSLGQCELTHLSRETIDVDVAREEHRRYRECLTESGVEVVCLPEEPDLPDSVFVEDTAVVLDELAVITRPGAISRRPEVDSVADALGSYRKLVYIRAPGTLDGGDVLVAGSEVYVGESRRTNRAGIEQLRAILSPLGYGVTGVEVKECLHLKSAISRVASDTVLLNSDWINRKIFKQMRVIDIDPSEPYGANSLFLGKEVLLSSSFPGTRQRLEAAGIPVKAVDLSELAKAEGGATCCSLMFEGQAVRA